MNGEATRQLTFRLPEKLVERVEDCVSSIQGTGLNVTRADVVRLLLNHALDTAGCDLDRLLGPRPTKRR